MTRILVVLAAVVLLGACADRYRVADLAASRSKEARLSLRATAYVSLPADGSYGATLYHGSGRSVARLVFRTFNRYLDRTEIASQVEPYEVALEKARSAGFTYLVTPTIVHWEDRQTAWSGRRDRAEIDLRVTEVSSGKILADGMLSGFGTRATLGGERPEDTLPEPINKFVDSLF